jgi:DNA-binding NtrC family response regulator
MAAILGASPAMRSVLERVALVCHSEAPVLITGESGTGKELVARALHFGGPRREKPFVAVNCAAFPDTLIESELFGHGKGAFTGAVNRRDGRFKMADHGTLFLDEIGELSLPAQAKLLRVLQEGTIEPLGVDGTVKVDVRILSATHRDLHECIVKGTFREDLYYRLKVLHIPLPPLRGRTEDLPLLVEHLVKRYASGVHPHITARAQEVLAAYPFPGNVRELENVIQHALVMSNGHDIDVTHLPGEVIRHAPVARLPDRGHDAEPYHPTESAAATSASAPAPAEVEAPPEVGGDPYVGYTPLPLADARRVFERAYLVQVLGQNRGRRTDTARALKISRKSLWEKLRDHGIRPEEYGGTAEVDEDETEAE